MLNRQRFSSSIIKIAPAGGDLVKMDKLFTKHWKDIYALSELIENRHFASAASEVFMESIVDRLKGL